MTTSVLNDVLTRHGLQVDEWRGGAGRFRDLYIGTGADVLTLLKCKDDFQGKGFTGAAVLYGDNPGHPAHGKPYLLLPSFWWDEQPPAPISAARAKEIIATAQAMEGFGPWSDRLGKVMTPGEDAYVRELWKTKPGHYSFVDTLLSIANNW